MSTQHRRQPKRREGDREENNLIPLTSGLETPVTEIGVTKIIPLPIEMLPPIPKKKPKHSKNASSPPPTEDGDLLIRETTPSPQLVAQPTATITSSEPAPTTFPNPLWQQQMNMLQGMMMPQCLPWMQQNWQPINPPQTQVTNQPEDDHASLYSRDNQVHDGEHMHEDPFMDPDTQEEEQTHEEENILNMFDMGEATEQNEESDKGEDDMNSLLEPHFEKKVVQASPLPEDIVKVVHRYWNEAGSTEASKYRAELGKKHSKPENLQTHKQAMNEEVTKKMKKEEKVTEGKQARLQGVMALATIPLAKNMALIKEEYKLLGKEKVAMLLDNQIDILKYLAGASYNLNTTRRLAVKDMFGQRYDAMTKPSALENTQLLFGDKFQERLQKADSETKLGSTLYTQNKGYRRNNQQSRGQRGRQSRPYQGNYSSQYSNSGSYNPGYNNNQSYKPTNTQRGGYQQTRGNPRQSNTNPRGRGQKRGKKQ